VSDSEKIRSLPLLPLKNTVLFPQLVLPLSVGRPASLKAVEAALATEEREIVVVAQKDSSVDEPGVEDLYTIGTIASLRRVNRADDNSMEVMVLGTERVVLLKLEEDGNYTLAKVRALPLPTDSGPEIEALKRAIMDLAARAITLAQPNAPAEFARFLAAADDSLRLVYLLASMLGLDIEKEQALLAADTCVDAMRLMHTYLWHELQVLELRSKIANEARTEMSKEQRDYLLRQQMRAIQQELGEKNPEQAEMEMLRERVDKAGLPEDVMKEAKRELNRLERLPAASPDHHVIRTWLEFVLELPWNAQTEDNLDIARARQILDEDHFDLKEVKERILEHLSVLKLNPSAKAPILCFVGPPGVGKTSLGQSIARSLGRKFDRMSLGGLHDEAELRGHRRTYIGAMPGRLMQSIRRAGAKNPVVMLDEVDKLGRDFRGDPASALLEVLDPEQNKTFRDNYLDLNFDLSKVLFITTANSLDPVPRPLLDRMEVLRLSGYSIEEKIEIAHRYLIPRQLKECGLTPEQCVIPDETLKMVISGYTREAGLRLLERAIGKLARKVALRFAEGNTAAVTIAPGDLFNMLGPEMTAPEKMRQKLPAGVAPGLAWTETGGDMLYVEATLLPDGKGLTLTGQLGDVMQESVKAAQSYIWAHAEEFGINPELFKTQGLHVHVPAGAIPKDGPSAGITTAVALASIYTKLPARADTAMTGEITLTGLVLPIGGVKEKVLAARRAGIKRVLLPRTNEKDLGELPEEVRNEMEFVRVDRVEEVLEATIPGLKERLATAVS
jgi:ATP-dependent Lon protease